MAINDKDLRSVFVEVFENSDIPIDISDLKVGDLDEWDSFGNFNLMLAVEETYGVKFDLDEMTKIHSVSALIESLNNKL